jgi:D-beta-D-heptose 7-phosphate kinase/D-beta-D-heptose 1-phosphate adenosyltransferase
MSDAAPRPSSLSLPDFSRAGVLIAGDVMLDRYWTGATRRISPEAPVPVVQIERIESRAGGAANVAAGVRALGASSTLVGMVGCDEAGAELARQVEGLGVRAALAASAQMRTVVKLRVLSQHQQMIRLDFEDDALQARALHHVDLAPWWGSAQVVVLSDYGKGALRDVAALIRAAAQAGKPVFVDPKRADLEAYRGATLLTPNRAEFEQAVGRCRSDRELVERGMKLLARHDWQALLLTLGEDGLLLLERGRPPLRVRAQAREVYDVTGAGDTVMAVLAAACAAGQALADAARLANVAAGIVVGKVGTATVGAREIEERLHAVELAQ